MDGGYGGGLKEVGVEKVVSSWRRSGGCLLCGGRWQYLEDARQLLVVRLLVLGRRQAVAEDPVALVAPQSHEILRKGRGGGAPMGETGGIDAGCVRRCACVRRTLGNVMTSDVALHMPSYTRERSRRLKM